MSYGDKAVVREIHLWKSRVFSNYVNGSRFGFLRIRRKDTKVVISHNILTCALTDCRKIMKYVNPQVSTWCGELT